ncbi:hypothetical protein WME99_30240 [Sorangium sp. So ce136]|uniref:hypothetical protein n=1 Tax=Sorangium sp. So ce136 TaxID=3133284 RepID=UPI003EFC59F7
MNPPGGSHGSPNEDEDELEPHHGADLQQAARPPSTREVAEMLGVAISPLRPEPIA